MIKITRLLIVCSLALAGSALAQQPEEQPSPKPPKSSEKGKGHTAAPTPAAKEAQPGAATPGAQAGEKPLATPAKHHAAAKAEKASATPPPAAAGAPEGNVSTPPPVTAASPAVKKHGKGKNETKATAAPNASPAPTAAVQPSTVPSAAPKSQPGARAAAAKKPDPQKVQEIKEQHANFHAQPKPDQVPAVTFNQSHRIEGSDRWQGQQYEVFRSYQPERHDEGWYRSHYDRVELVGGGYYYQRDGYWYPAWGYNPSSEYYAYDGPIYAGRRVEPPDRVIADVQAALQHLDYYKGDVDGLLGPMTREALTGYQTDQGLTQTAAIDEPTLNALGMD